MEGYVRFSGYFLAGVICCSLLLYRAAGQTSLSSEDQQELLNAHNHFRGIVSPHASNMERMVSLYYRSIADLVDICSKGWVTIVPDRDL